MVDSRYGFTIGNPARFGSGSYPDEHLYQVQEGLDWVRGGLLVKAGADWSHNADATSMVPNHTGTYYYSTPENFASDALAFSAFGLSDALDPLNQHNCDERGKAWRDADHQLHGLGYLPCYSYYSQTMGPTNWYLSTNDLAGYATTQWQPGNRGRLVMSAALRWDRELLPPPIALVNNPELPLTQKLPLLGNQWGPRASLAWGSGESRWPTLRAGYGMYFGRTQNAVLETALTQTGSLKGDLNFFMRPTDNLVAGGAPPFPYVLAGQPATVVKPGAVEFAPTFHNPEIHQGEASLQERPSRPCGSGCHGHGQSRPKVTGHYRHQHRPRVTRHHHLWSGRQPQRRPYQDASSHRPLLRELAGVRVHAGFRRADRIRTTSRSPSS